MDAIKRCREKAGLSRIEMAERLHIHEESLARYERGDRDPSASLIKDMAVLLGCTTDDLLNPPQPRQPGAECAAVEPVVAEG